MARSDATEGRLPRGVTALPRARGGRRFRARIRRGKGVEVHLGLYETPALAAFAYHVAAQAIGRHGGTGAPEIPRAEEPTADRVRAITERVRRRLGLEPPPPRPADLVPTPDEVQTLFEITVIGFWRDQAARPDSTTPAAALDTSARRLVEAARVVFWCHSAGMPTALEVMADLLARRLDQTFRRADLTREILDDDGDEPIRVARWLVHPESYPGAHGRGFRREVEHLYPDHFGTESEPAEPASWAVILGVRPPFTPEQVRRAYRARSRLHHPDAGGDHEAFVRLQSAYDEARRYCELMGE